MSYLERLKQLETHQSLTDRTDRNASVGFVSPLPVRIAMEPLPDPAMEGRRQRVLKMLAERPGRRYAVVVDNPDTDRVSVALAVRGVATCELRISRAKYDPFLLLDLIGRHGGSVH